MVSDNTIFLGVDYSISIYSSIDSHNAYICIQNSIGMFQVGVERWFVLPIWLFEKCFLSKVNKKKKLINFVLFQRFNAF